MAQLAYSPIAFLTASLGFQELAVGGALVAVAFAMVPDLDLRVPFVAHRGPTHTVWFTVLLGGLAGLVGLVAGAARGVLEGVGLGIFAGVVVSVTLASHLAADALTPMGIRPWTPRSKRRVSFDLVRAANPIANSLLFGSGLVAVAAGYAAGDALAATLADGALLARY